MLLDDQEGGAVDRHPSIKELLNSDILIPESHEK